MFTNGITCFTRNGVVLGDRYRLAEKINLYFIRLPIRNYLPDVKLTEEEIKNFYERNKDLLKEPLKVQVEYLFYPFDRFSSSAQITDKEIRITIKPIVNQNSTSLRKSKRATF